MAVSIHPMSFETPDQENGPDRLVADELVDRLRATDEKRSQRIIGNKILVFEKTASTNDLAHRFGKENHPEGLVIFAEAQSAGRGRHGRTWFSPPRKNLLFSILARPKIELAATPKLTILIAVAVARALERTTGLKLQVKWPNDILCRNRKVAGILVELHAGAGEVRHVVIGIGINVNLSSEEIPLELRDKASSLSIEAGKSFARLDLATAILKEVHHYYSILENDDFSYILDQWLSLDCTLGKQISIRWSNGRMLCGQASSLDEDGALLVRNDEGVIERVTAGEVTLSGF